LLFFIFWVIWVFPYDALKSRIITEVENGSRGLYRLDVGDMDLSLLGSLTFKNLSVFERNSSGETNILKTPYLKIGFSPFIIFSKKPDFSYRFNGTKGNVAGSYVQTADGMEFSADFDEFPLGDLQYLANKLKIPMKGVINGEVSLNLNRADASKNSGAIDLRFENLILEPIQIASSGVGEDGAPSSGMVELPAIKLSGPEDSVLKGEIKKEDFILQSLTLKGGDIDLDLSGKITMSGASAKEYRVAIQGNGKMSDSLYKALIKINPMVEALESQKTPEGYLPLNFTGRLTKPNIRVGKFPLPLFRE